MLNHHRYLAPLPAPGSNRAPRRARTAVAAGFAAALAAAPALASPLLPGVPGVPAAFAAEPSTSEAPPSEAPSGNAGGADSEEGVREVDEVSIDLVGDANDNAHAVANVAGEDHESTDEAAAVAIKVPEAVQRPPAGEDPAADGAPAAWVLPHLAFDVSRAGAGLLAEGAQAELHLELLHAPHEARVSICQPGEEQAGACLDSLTPSLLWTFAPGVRADSALYFSAPGSYLLRFSYAVAGNSFPVDVTFVVGDASLDDAAEDSEDDNSSADPAPAEQAEPTASAGAASERGAIDPNQLTRDLNDITKELQRTDRELTKAMKAADELVAIVPLPGADKTQGAKAQGNKAQGGNSRANGSQGGAKQHAGAHKSAQGAPRASASAASARPASAPAAARAAGNPAPKAAAQAKPAAKASAKPAENKPARAAASAAAKAPAARAVPDAADASQAKGAVDASLTPAAVKAARVNFGAGVLVGLGALCLLGGIGLFIYVQFFRPKNSPANPAQDPGHPAPPAGVAPATPYQGGDATSQFDAIR